MKMMLTTIILAAAVTSLAGNALSADKGVVNLVEPVVAPVAVEAVKDAKGKTACTEGQVLQKNGACCPTGMTNTLWQTVCVPNGTIDDQIFNSPEGTRYCPKNDMFIVSDKTRTWTSCAASDSTPLNRAEGSPGSEFCMGHGYGYLLKIKPWGTVGCIKIGDSQGDGCIEAGTCSFASGR